MNISVIICTYNRCENLRRTLEMCRALQTPTGVTWELLVVDNNSSDSTKEVCEEFTGKLPLRYLFEARQGKTCAQNLGVRQAQGELLVFTDDDVSVTPDWLANYWKATKENREVSIFGGKILPLWLASPPKWLADHSRDVAGISIHYDQGDQEKFFSGDGTFPFGANMALRRHIFSTAIGFRENIGPKGRELTTHEETELLRRLALSGHSWMYLPTVIVHHRNPPERMTERYLRKFYIADGLSETRLYPRQDHLHVWFGVPRYLWRRLVESSLKYGLARWTRPARVWLRHEITMARTWGVITESRRQMRREQLPT